MKRVARRDFLRSSLAGGLAVGLPGLARGAEGTAKAAGPNAEVRIAVIGLGSVDAIGGVGARGRQLIGSLRKVPAARIVALCDVDKAHLDREVQQLKNRGGEIAAYADIRRVLDDKSVDAVAIATPNHWHALATVWACQAGKDVYVEKPFSYNIWEGRQMVAAARKHGRMVQVGTQSRSSTVFREAFKYLRSGQLGPIRYAHALVYRARDGMPKASGPGEVPATVDYDLWCGPAAKGPLFRKQLHYDWHWFWETGNGEIGNNGAHVIDVCRWALGQDRLAPRAMSIGGRFGFDDGGETPNTQIALLDYQPAPLICEVRNLRASKDANAMGRFRNRNTGVVIDCEGGYFAGDNSGGALYDRQDKKIQDIQDGRKGQGLEVAHLANFLAAVRSRRAGELNAEALQGHLSAAGSHMANISYRLGKRAAPEAIVEANRASSDLVDSLKRCQEYLRANGVDLSVAQPVAGPWVTLDPSEERFVGEFAEQANALSRRKYREPFVVPRIS